MISEMMFLTFLKNVPRKSVPILGLAWSMYQNVGSLKWNILFRRVFPLLRFLSSSSFVDRPLTSGWSSLVATYFLSNDFYDTCSSWDILNRWEERHAINRIHKMFTKRSKCIGWQINVTLTLYFKTKITSSQRLHCVATKTVMNALDLSNSSTNQSAMSKTSTSTIFLKGGFAWLLHQDLQL